ncbi:hypothetical protein T484DRAFT_1856270 [Baffinella frigidus]|nr:hypothetical protein T484DRAFT_1856270 [Cryptophyta sp. CCMP2293]
MSKEAAAGASAEGTTAQLLIETLGISKKKDLVTVVSLYDPEAGISRVLRFVELNEDCDVVYADDYLDTVATLVEYLDKAEYLISFNGVSFDADLITVATIYDPTASPPIDRVFRFVELNHKREVVYTDNYLDTVAELVECLNEADNLCGFNCYRFDIEFLAVQFGIPQKTIEDWKRKLFDVFQVCYTLKSKRTFKQDAVLALNGFSSGKTGDGAQAVTLAKEGKWGQLEDYCRADSRLTHELSSLSTIFCPESWWWRKRNDGKTHDPARVFTINTEEFPKLSFSYRPLPGYTADKILGKDGRARHFPQAVDRVQNRARILQGYTADKAPISDLGKNARA